MVKEYPLEYKGKGLKIGIVQARFSRGITDELLHACLNELTKLQVKSKNISIVTVPGALEIPVTLQELLTYNNFDAMVAIGAVIRGETYHFELVSNNVGEGIMNLSLDFSIPIANSVLTTENDEQAIVRAKIKGKEAARVAVEMANHFKNIKSKGKS